jgi:sortase A
MSSTSSVAIPARPQRRPRRLVRALSRVLIVLGLLVVVDAIVTLVWQEPLSALYAQLQQDRLAADLRGLDRAQPTPLERRTLAQLHHARHRIAFLAGQLHAGASTGSAVGRIEIPRIGVNFVVVAGTSTAALRSGPGIYPQAVFPGMQGTVAIAGHRTTYLAPFRHIDALRAGDAIVLQMPYGRFRYVVERQRVVAPQAVGVVIGAGQRQLVLSACTPLYSAAQRILVFARLTSERPLGAAL